MDNYTIAKNEKVSEYGNYIFLKGDRPTVEELNFILDDLRVFLENHISEEIEDCEIIIKTAEDIKKYCETEDFINHPIKVSLFKPTIGWKIKMKAT